MQWIFRKQYALMKHRYEKFDFLAYEQLALWSPPVRHVAKMKPMTFVAHCANRAVSSQMLNLAVAAALANLFTPKVVVASLATSEMNMPNHQI